MQIQRSEIVVAGAVCFGADGLESRPGEGGVDVRVVVYVGTEVGASRLTDGVSTYIGISYEAS
jgi:hypothetical protein